MTKRVTSVVILEESTAKSAISKEFEMQQVHQAFDCDHRVVTVPACGDASPEPAPVGMAAGWLIAEKSAVEIDARGTDDPSPWQRSPRCLQLGTGQWCSARWATWFPAPGPAIRYAVELGFKVGDSVEIIFLRRDR
ncbi:hypothetical protein Mal15_46650 [Stieleria maiorica]|uniref:Uncharacterized protein n=1 Tax=Stieleria maiorica TaxID=2795974 RepID=A0A5B9MI61_9BACT|nr:hypothetical protein [Stieleria maiorica]QEG00594.1 hypothetical protein Mal15_46650 [Stieleria maiorica]